MSTSAMVEMVLPRPWSSAKMPPTGASLAVSLFIILQMRGHIRWLYGTTLVDVRWRYVVTAVDVR